jgi:hypothetical protein
VAQVELVQIDLHAATLPVLAARIDRVLRRPGGMSDDSPNDLGTLLSHLVLHEQPHHSDNSRKDHTAFEPHLVLHHVPGQSGRRWRCIRRWRHYARLRLRGRERLAPPPITVVVPIRGAPPPVGAAMPLVLTRLAIARVLSIAYARVR